MLKQLAWAAAMSSSGFAPGVPSKRVLKLYGVPLIAPLATENVPWPSLSPPSHFALALRFIVVLLQFSSVAAGACSDSWPRSPPSWLTMEPTGYGEGDHHGSR